MLRLITTLSAVAAVGSVAMTWPSVSAQPAAVKMSAKRAGLLGLPYTEAPAPEQTVGNLIVKLRASSGLVQAQSGAAYARAMPAVLGAGIRTVTQISDDTALMALNAPLPLSEARAVAARLASDPAVEYAEPDVIMKPFAVPNETDFLAKQWYLFAPTTDYTGATTVNNMAGPPKTAPATGGANLPTAWDTTKGAASVVVAIIDTGIVNHPELNNANLNVPLTYMPGGRFLAGYDFVSTNALGLPNGTVEGAEGAGQVGRDANPADPGDAVSVADRANPLCNDNTPNQGTAAAPSTWHGTHSAGIVAATTNNSTGIAGIGWENIRVVPVRALGRCGGAMSDMADAIRWAAGLDVAGATPTKSANPANVILVGAGGKAGVACSQTLQQAIDAAVATGAVVVAAAGNEGSVDGISAPANCNGVIGVTAHAINGENASYSNIGPAGGAGPNPLISAPGGGSPASLGADPTGAGGGVDDPTWDGFRIWSTTPSGAAAPAQPPTYSGKIGTSAAAAQVAGVAALVKSKQPSATPVQVRGALQTSARPFPELSSCAPGRTYAGRCGIGMLDATRALQAAGPPTVLTPPQAVQAGAGQTATFNIEAIGAESYQWVRNGVAIPGATTPTYTTPPLAATDNNAAFQVNMSNSFGGTTSTAAVLTVTGTSSNSPSSSSGGGALPMWQLLLLASLLLASRVRFTQRER